MKKIEKKLCDAYHLSKREWNKKYKIKDKESTEYYEYRSKIIDSGYTKKQFKDCLTS